MASKKRTKLQKFQNSRQRFYATFAGYFKHRSKDRVLLRNVYNHQDEKVADHVWQFATKRFRSQGCQKGDVITFTAIVTCYRKTRDGMVKTDYGLRDAQKIEIIDREVD